MREFENSFFLELQVGLNTHFSLMLFNYRFVVEVWYLCCVLIEGSGVGQTNLAREPLSS